VKTTLEQHYTPEQLGKRWHCSANTVRRLCEEFGGVLMIVRPETMHKRGYTSIRIPESTADAMYAKFFMPRAA
jgi:hypothetical protein